MTNTTQEILSPDYLAAVAFILVQVFGVLGNTLVIYSIFNQKNYLNSNYYNLTLHLAFSDLLHLLLKVRTICNLSLPNLRLFRSVAQCKIWSPMETTVVLAGINVMVVIGIFRYRAVVHPLKRAISRRKLKVTVAFVYIFAIICVIPYILVLKYMKTSNECVEEWPDSALNVAYTLFLFLIQYFIPIAMLTILYFKICKTLLKKSKTTKFFSSTGTAGSEAIGECTRLQRLKHHRNIRTFIVSVTVVMCFGVTTLPHQLWWLLNAGGKVEKIGKFQMWLEIIHLTGTSAVNPFIYGTLDPTLRSAFKRVGKKLIVTLK